MSDSDDDRPVKDPDEYCNARKTGGSGYCQHEAGWGTDHPGVGRCKFHGGNTPDQERKIIDELSDASEHAAVAVALQLKRMREQLERGEEIDPRDLDRLARSAWDYDPEGPTEQTEVSVTHEGDLLADFDS
jgi:hypothetical protein